MRSDETLVDEARLSALRRAMPAKAFERSVAAFRSTLLRRVPDVATAIAERRWSDAARVGHSLKGVSGNFGALRLAAVSEALEAALTADDPAVSVELATELAETAALTDAALTAALARNAGS